MDLDKLITEATGRRRQAVDLDTLIATVAGAEFQGDMFALPDPTRLKGKGAREAFAKQVKKTIPPGWRLTQVGVGESYPTYSVRMMSEVGRSNNRLEDEILLIDVMRIDDWMRSRQTGKLPFGAVDLIFAGRMTDAVSGDLLGFSRVDPEIVKSWGMGHGPDPSAPRGWRRSPEDVLARKRTDGVKTWEPRSSAWKRRPWMAIFSRSEDPEHGADYSGWHSRLGWSGSTIDEVLDAAIRDIMKPVSQGKESWRIVPIGPSYRARVPAP